MAIVDDIRRKQEATKGLVSIEQMERMRVLWKKGRNMFSSFFSEADAVKQQIGNSELFSQWCFFQLQIDVTTMSNMAAILRQGDAARIRTEFAEAKRAEKERREAEAHARQLAKVERDNAIAAKRMENAERKAQEAAEAKKEKKAAIAAENRRRREEKDRTEGDAITRAKAAILANPMATRDKICDIADTHAIFYNKAIGELEGSGWVNPRAPKGDEVSLYDRYVAEGKTAANHQWTLGDLAIKVSQLNTYGEGKLERYSTDIGVEYSTLENYRWSAEAWPQNFPTSALFSCEGARETSRPPRYHR